LEHERQYLNKNYKNWEDLRKSFLTDRDREEQLNRFAKQDFQHFIKGNDMNAWCHGAAGAGLTRVYNYEALQPYKHNDEELTMAINKTHETELGKDDREMEILCHGYAGNGNLFVAEYLRTGNSEMLEKAQAVAEKIIRNAKERGNYRCGYGAPPTTSDTSLFMGNAGIGWYFLRCLFPNQIEDILCPSLPEVDWSNHFKSFTNESIWKLILEKYPVNAQQVQTTEFTLGSLKTVLKSPELDFLQKDALQPSFALTHAAKSYYHKNPQLTEKDILSVAPHIFIRESGEDLELFISEGEGISTFQISGIAQILMQRINESSIGYQDLHHWIFNEFEVDEQEKEALKQAIDGQLQEFLKAGIIWKNISEDLLNQLKRHETLSS
ncbi:MAG: lanthionine synthetase LanC family protein, partial [Luteibaculum sp.]